MRRLKFLKRFLHLCFLLAYTVSAQQPAASDTGARKQILIIHADRIGFKEFDSANRFQLLVGSVAVKQEQTYFYCDSAAINTTAATITNFTFKLSKSVPLYPFRATSAAALLLYPS